MIRRRDSPRFQEPPQRMQRRTIIVDGPLAFRMRRIEAARAGEIGVDILTLPLLAARLAGGFARPATGADIEQAARAALDNGGFATLERARDLPGIVRAAGRSLRALWEEGLSLERVEPLSTQLGDLALLERRVRDALPAGVLSQIDLRERALERLAHAPAVLGAVELDRVFHVAPVWRALLNRLHATTPVVWRAPSTGAAVWFEGVLQSVESDALPEPVHELCANPRAEAVEALRWMRSLIAAGAPPADIGICAASVEAWDDHFLALSREADLPLYFAHGLPALATEAGQACAALADLLLRGLDQERFRRVASYAHSSALLGQLEAGWHRNAGLSAEARLISLEDWRAAFAAASATHPEAGRIGAIVLPAIVLVARGREDAAAAGSALLPPEARPIWASALRRAPAAALEQSLRDLRFADAVDPGACAVWGPASLLAGAPRKHMRLLGVSARGWPRQSLEDPLLPPHVAPAAFAQRITAEALDRATFAHLVERASGSLVISRSRRNAQGARLGASPLVAGVKTWRELRRDRRPEHAFNESDRLTARPEDMGADAHIVSATACFRNWRRSELTPHDGKIRENHPLILETLAKTQSATHLRLMLRDPLAYVWRYALGWAPPRELSSPLTLDPMAYGQLVHELLRRAMQVLEPEPGCANATPDEIVHAVDAAADEVREEWPLRRAAPPALLWRHTLARAANEAKAALKLKPPTGGRAWPEVGFGRSADDGPADLPWRPTQPVVLQQSGLKVGGFIDRLDRRDNACRVTDYKTGEGPPEQDFTMRGGLELQRVLYTIAVRQALPEVTRVQALLLYLGGERPRVVGAEDIDAGPFEGFVAAAADVQRAGACVAGIDAFEDFNDFRLALPAQLDIYKRRKQAARAVALKSLSSVWGIK